MVPSISRELLTWYSGVARDLPWRRSRDAYAIWVSEVMLQQTRVDTVIPYFERFMRRFPTPKDLANAEEDEVLALWSGLGYYRRARQLMLAAKDISRAHGGKLPSDVESLRKLPGIGAYTAGAVASIAFGAREPLVDGNVERVLARLAGIRDDVRSAENRKKIWGIARELVSARRPGDFNQALMELGATVCTPKAPKCGSCPIAEKCTAFREERTELIPVILPKRPVQRVEMLAMVVRHEDKIFLAKRKPLGLFGGLWEPPMAEVEANASEGHVLSLLGIRSGGLRFESRGSVHHVLSHRRFDVRVVVAAVRRPAEIRWVKPSVYERGAFRAPETSDVGTSTLTRKILRKALA